MGIEFQHGTSEHVGSEALQVSASGGTPMSFGKAALFAERKPVIERDDDQKLNLTMA